MDIENQIRGIRIPELYCLAVDAFSTIFSKPQLNLSARVYSVLASHGYPVRLDDGDNPLWRVYEDYRALDYRGEISGPERWAAICNALNIEAGPEVRAELNLAEFDEHRQHTRLFPGVLEFLAWARSNYHLNLCTTASEVGWHFEQLMLLPGYFNTVALSREQHCDKEPAEGETDADTLFAKLPKITGYEPAQILVIDDNIGYLERCKRLGFWTCLPLQGEAIGHYDPKAAYNDAIDIVAPIPELKRWLDPAYRS